jgi:hypothetical protein
MESDVEHRPQEGVITAAIRGELDNTSCMEAVRRVVELRERTGCLRLLLDCREARVTETTAGIYENPGRILAAGLTRAGRIALVYSRDREAHVFWETVSRNHGYDARVFRDLDAALDWLRAEDGR